MPRHASTRPVLRKAGRVEPAAKLAQPLKMVGISRPLWKDRHHGPGSDTARPDGEAAQGGARQHPCSFRHAPPASQPTEPGSATTAEKCCGLVADADLRGQAVGGLLQHKVFPLKSTPQARRVHPSGWSRQVGGWTASGCRRVALQRVKRTGAGGAVGRGWQIHRGAGANWNQLRGIAQIVSLRGGGTADPSPAAQSFWPASDTPKHFSFSAAEAAPSERAAASAPAITSVVDWQDMWAFLCFGCV